MIVRDRDVHHRADHHLAAARDGPILDLVHAEDARLRRVEDRCREQRAEHAAVGDRERSAHQVAGRQLSLARAPRDVGDGLLQRREPQRLGAAHDRHHEAARRADRDAEVDVARLDDVGAVDPRVEDRHLAQPVDHRAREQRHQPEINAVARLEALAMTRTQRE